MNNTLPAALKEESFRFSPLKCREVGITLQAAKFLRWLYIEPGRTNAQIVATFGMGLAWTMLGAGNVTNPLGEVDSPNTNLWSLTGEGIEILRKLVS